MLSTIHELSSSSTASDAKHEELLTVQQWKHPAERARPVPLDEITGSPLKSCDVMLSVPRMRSEEKVSEAQGRFKAALR